MTCGGHRLSEGWPPRQDPAGAGVPVQARRMGRQAALAAEFGEAAVFKAGFNLRSEDEYPPVLEDMAADCPIVLVCIGPRWIAARNTGSTRRLDDSHDWSVERSS